MNNTVNIGKVRKERDRSSRKARSDENAVQFGQSKSQKEALKLRAEKIARTLDGQKKAE